MSFGSVAIYRLDDATAAGVCFAGARNELHIQANQSVSGPPPKHRAPRDKEKSDVKRLANVSKPTLTVFQPAEGKRNGAAVIVCPGGGYNILAWDLEGTEVAEWLLLTNLTSAEAL